MAPKGRESRGSHPRTRCLTAALGVLGVVAIFDVVACSPNPGTCETNHSCSPQVAGEGGVAGAAGGAAGEDPDDGGSGEGGAGNAGSSGTASGGTAGTANGGTAGTRDDAGAGGAEDGSGGEAGGPTGPCAEMPCEHGACATTGREARCVCNGGFTGELCELPRFEPLGFLPGFEEGFGWALSRDGRVAFGWDEDAESNTRAAFRWTRQEGNQLFGPQGVTPQGTNADGSVVAGYAPYGSTGTINRAFRWSMETGFVDLGVLTGGDTTSSSLATAVSADGAVVVGQSDLPSGTLAFRWTTASGMVSLGLPPGASASATSQALGTNADGRVVVGVVNDGTANYPFLWTAASGIQRLGTLSEGAAQATNADGSVVVGYADFSGVTRSFRWTEATGAVPLEMPSDCTQAGGWDVSDDGHVVAIICVGSELHAFVWNDRDGMRRVASVLQGLGAVLTDWSLEYAWRVSGDGQSLLGIGVNPQGRAEPWMARL